MEFAIFDHIYDSVLVYDKEGLLVYCNEAFSVLSGISAHRMVGKMDLTKVFTEIEGSPINLTEFIHHKEATNTRVIRYSTRAVNDGLAQFSVTPMTRNKEKLFVFVMKDLSVEEELHKKYRREMTLKDNKIEEMNAMIQLLQRTRLVKEPRKILEEFLKHILSQYSLAVAFIKEGDSRVYKIPEKNPAEDSASIDRLTKKIAEMKPLDEDTFFSSDALAQIGLKNLPHVQSLVGIPIGTNMKSSFEIFIPMPSADLAHAFDQNRVSALSQQMALVIDNMTLEKLSIVDDLTKLHNARHFREKLDEYTTKYPALAMVLGDIDHFKVINDTYGHPGGDTVLQRVGIILRQMVENNSRENMVFRVGGEEFSILFPNKTPQEAAAVVNEIAEKIRQEIIPYQGKNIKLTMSFGVSEWSSDKISVRDFYMHTDEALYSSKRNGRDRITIYSDDK